MAQLKNDFTVTLNDAKAKIYHLVKFAEQRQKREDPLYGLYDVILNLLASTVATKENSSLSSFPQWRLISIARELEGLSLAKFKTVIPDFALLLIHINGLDGTTSATAPLFLEIKPLKPRNAGDPPLLWYSKSGLFAARGDILFSLAYQRQILSQGFCALNAYPGGIMNLIFVVGIYFTHFTFTRPAILANVPMHLPEVARIRYIEANITKLLPFECIGIQAANRCIFDDASKDGLRLSNVFLTALRDCLLVIPGATSDMQSYAFFSTIPDHRGGDVAGKQDDAKDDNKALNDGDIGEEAWRQPTKEEAENTKKELLASLERHYTVAESHLEDASPDVSPAKSDKDYQPPTTRGRNVFLQSTPPLTRQRSRSQASTRSESPSDQPARRRRRIHSPNPFSDEDADIFEAPTLELDEDDWMEEDTSFMYGLDDEDAE